MLGPLDMTALAAAILERSGGAAPFATVVAVAQRDAAVRACPLATEDALKAALARALASSVLFLRGWREPEGETWMLSSEALGFASDGSDDEDDAFPRSLPHAGAGADAAAVDTFLFARTPLSSPQLAADIRYDSVAGAVHRILEEQADAAVGANAGAAHEDDIAEVMLESWVRPARSMTDAEVRSLVALTLRTSPLFRQCRASPRFWALSDRCRSLPRRWRRGRSQATAAPSDASSSSTLSQSSGCGSSTNTTTTTTSNSSSSGSDSKATTAALVAASTAAAIAAQSCCHCGATTPSRGPNARWKRGFKPGTVVCLSCSAARPRSMTCPVCGRVYRRDDPWSGESSANRRAALMAAAAVREYEGDYTGDLASDEDSAADDWLACDDCKRWVMVRCDDTITDINQYSDDNPRPLHYSCPSCRKRRRCSSEQHADAHSGSSSDACIEATLASLSRKFDELVAGARHAADGHGRHSAASAFRADDLAVFEANLIKRCEGALRRVMREQEALVERSDRELQTRRAEFEQDFAHQFRDFVDKHHQVQH